LGEGIQVNARVSLIYGTWAVTIM